MIAYTSHGEGPPVVLLHGFCESGAIWNYLLPFLPSTYTYIIPDIPGFGSSPLPEGQFALSDIAAELLTWMKDIGLTDFAVIGHSLGGYISLEMAHQAPKDCYCISLFHSTAYADNPEKKRNRTKSAEFIRKNGKDAFLKTFISGLYYQTGPWVHEVEHMVNGTGAKSIISFTLAMRDRPDHRDLIKQFNGRIQFIAGDKDTFISADSLRDQADLSPNAKLNLLENIGHLGMMEDPELSGSVITDFLESVESSP